MDEIPVKTVELKWEGYMLPSAHIAAQTRRRFDAIWILHSDPTRVLLQTFSDATLFQPDISGTGLYALTYRVIADNFPSARCIVKLDLHSSHLATTLV